MNCNAGWTYYLLHRAVIRATDSERKICVVFNASFCTTGLIKWHFVARAKVAKWPMTGTLALENVPVLFNWHCSGKSEYIQKILICKWLASASLEEMRDFKRSRMVCPPYIWPYICYSNLLPMKSTGSLSGHWQSRKICMIHIHDILSRGDHARSFGEQDSNRNFVYEGFELNKWAGLHKDLCPSSNNSQRLFSDSRRRCLWLFGIQNKTILRCE